MPTELYEPKMKHKKSRKSTIIEVDTRHETGLESVESERTVGCQSTVEVDTSCQKYPSCEGTVAARFEDEERDNKRNRGYRPERNLRLSGKQSCSVEFCTGSAFISGAGRPSRQCGENLTVVFGISRCRMRFVSYREKETPS